MIDRMEENKTALAIGAFDGLHKGHMSVINSTVGIKGLTPAVLTFEENPSVELNGKSAYIITQGEKEELLKEAGIEEIFILDFSKVRNMTTKDFFYDVLLKKCRSKYIYCGENFRFGKNAQGDVKLLKELCVLNDVNLKIIPYSLYKTEVISSTKIRTAVQNGDMQLVKKYLGRYFGFKFLVVKGNQIGRTLGAPTINQVIPKGFVLPKYGVYASRVTLNNEIYCGVTNIGVKPSIGKYEPGAETWIIGVDKDMYGMHIKVELLKFIRNEKKFSSLEELKSEIIKDAETAKNIYKTIYK